MRVLLGIVFAVATVVLSSASAGANCDAELVRAFSDITKESSSQFSYRRVMELSCQQKDVGFGIKASLPFEGIPLTNSASYSSTSNACLSRNEEYFKSYAKDLFVAKASETVKLALIQQCFGSQPYISISENIGGMTVFAFARPINEIPLVENFSWSPRNAALPVGSGFQTGEPVGGNGKVHLYERIDLFTDINFAMNIRPGGAASAVAVGVTESPITWRIVFPLSRYSNRIFQCVADVGALRNQVIGEKKDAAIMGFPGLGNANLMLSHCIDSYGRGIATAPYKRNPWLIKDKWDTVDLNPGDNTRWLCKRGGETLGITNCIYGQNHQACVREESRRAQCVASFGGYSRSAEVALTTIIEGMSSDYDGDTE